MWIDGADHDVGIDFDEMVIAEVLEYTMAYQSIGLIDHDLILIRLGGGWIVSLYFFSHNLLSVANINYDSSSHFEMLSIPLTYRVSR